MSNFKSLCVVILLSFCLITIYIVYQNHEFIESIHTSYLLKINDKQLEIQSDIVKESTILRKIKLEENAIEDLLKNAQKNVYKYIVLPLDFRYGSNAIPLAVAALSARGDLLELGMGMFSTPLLHKIAIDQNRLLVSVDTELGWVQKFTGYNSTQHHRIYHLGDPNKMHSFGLDKKWGMVLVDHLSGETRYQDVINFANISQMVVVHDAERVSESYYNYERNKIRNYFSYTCKYSLYDQTKSNYISTLLLSNFVNMDKFKSIFQQIPTDYGHVACDVNY